MATSATRLLRNPKIQITGLLAISATVACADTVSPTNVLPRLGMALAIAILAEWAIFGSVRSQSLQSAIVTAVIVGMLLSPNSPYHVIWLATVVAIASKKVFQFDEGRHIFNPAAFGLIAASLLSQSQINWWGFSSPYIVIVGCGIILYRLNRLSLPFAYLAGRVGSTLVVSGGLAGTGAFSLANLFFAFIILIEPKTSPGNRPAQWGFGILTGGLATVMFRFWPVMDGDLLALLMLNLARPAVELACRRTSSPGICAKEK